MGVGSVQVAAGQLRRALLALVPHTGKPADEMDRVRVQVGEQVLGWATCMATLAAARVDVVDRDGDEVPVFDLTASGIRSLTTVVAPPKVVEARTAWEARAEVLIDWSGLDAGHLTFAMVDGLFGGESVTVAARPWKAPPPAQQQPEPATDMDRLLSGLDEVLRRAVDSPQSFDPLDVAPAALMRAAGWPTTTARPLSTHPSVMARFVKSASVLNEELLVSRFATPEAAGMFTVGCGPNFFAVGSAVWAGSLQTGDEPRRADESPAASLHRHSWAATMSHAPKVSGS